MLLYLKHVALESLLFHKRLTCSVCVLFVPDLRQELAVRQKERRPSSSLGKDSDRADVPGAGNPSIPVTPSKPISSFATPPASSIRRGKCRSCGTEITTVMLIIPLY